MRRTTGTQPVAPAWCAGATHPPPPPSAPLPARCAHTARWLRCREYDRQSGFPDAPWRGTALARRRRHRSQRQPLRSGPTSRSQARPTPTMDRRQPPRSARRPAHPTRRARREYSGRIDRPAPPPDRQRWRSVRPSAGSAASPAPPRASDPEDRYAGDAARTPQHRKPAARPYKKGRRGRPPERRTDRRTLRNLGPSAARKPRKPARWQASSPAGSSPG